LLYFDCCPAASIPPERAFELLTQVKEAERMIVRGGGLKETKNIFSLD
jgi:hypothetical protein